MSARDRILAAAERLIGQSGFAATRLSSIASAAGLGNAGLLHHFPSKAALYRVVLEDIAADIHMRIGLEDPSGDAISNLKQLVEGFLAFHRDRSSAMAIIAHEFLDQSGRIEEAEVLPLARVVEDTVAVLEAGQIAGTIREGDTLAMTAALHGALIIGCIGQTVYRRTSGQSPTEAWEAELARSAIASVLLNPDF
ncbi:MAG: TetR/AcrR family transcriptional regulator [Chloroflexota bacterium]